MQTICYRVFYLILGLTYTATVITANTTSLPKRGDTLKISPIEAILPKTIIESEAFEVEYSVKTVWKQNKDSTQSSKEPSITEPQLMASKHFRLTKGPRRSSSFTFTKDSITMTHTYSYYLSPIRKGKFKLPSFTVFINEKKYTSPTRHIHVTVSPDIGRTTVNTPSRVRCTSPQIDNIFIKPLLSNDSIHLGDSVSLAFKIYFPEGVNIEGYTLNHIEIPFCYFTENEAQPQGPHPETYQQKKYNTIEIYKKYMLTPLQEGNITIPPIKFKLQIPVPYDDPNENDPFNAFFNKTTTLTYTCYTSPITIYIHP